MSRLKILALTSRYPPYHLGGYGIRCKDILDSLAGRGHAVLVITSIKDTTAKSAPPISQYPILRKLHIRNLTRGLISQIEGWHRTHVIGLFLAFLRELTFDILDTRFIARQIDHFQPDVIYLGHILPLSKAILPFLALQKTPLIYDEGGSGLIDAWVERGMWFVFVERYSNKNFILKWISPLIIKSICTLSGQRIKSKWDWPTNLHIYFNSALNQNNAIAKGVPIKNAPVIQSGIDTIRFGFKPRIKLGSPISFILPGRIEPRKGQLDVVRLLVKLLDDGIDGNAIFIGEKNSNSYFDELENEIGKFRLEDKIKIMPMIANENLVALYHKADICFFPSYYKTGYSRVSLEAMACGCIVVSYGNEGSDEIIRNKQTGFIVSPGDFSSITKTIEDLTSNPEMVGNLTWQARKDLEIHYSMQAYVDRIEGIMINATKAC